jgi:hypothetical protein
MMDDFFKRTTCQRCGGSLENGRICSMLNTQTICMDCKDAETKHPDYEKARQAELEEVKKGNYNYGGLYGK